MKGKAPIGMVFASGRCDYLSAMQINTLLIPAFLLAFTAGCKSKQEMPDTTGKPSSTEKTAQGDHAPAVQETLPEETAEQASTPKIGADSVFFSMERTPCFGSCPAYKVTIMQDGSAVYEGRRFAAREGRYIGHVDEATMKKLTNEADARGFFAMEDKYDSQVTDLPSTIIRVHADGRDKQVIGRVGTPQAFKNMAQEVEKILVDVEWTKTGDLR